jgi:dipeptidyl aminopeptidase/acylaminoacyl peptidase
MPPASTSPFDQLSDYVAIPRVTGLVLAPDGSRLVATVSRLSRDGKKFLTALWDVDPDGRRDAQRLTFAGESDSAPAFLPGGEVLFLSRRPDPEPGTDGSPDYADRTGLWLLPATGEARLLAQRSGGFDRVHTALDAGTVVLTACTSPGATDEESDDRRRKTRADLGVRAILHEESPVRFWDHDLGPDERRLYAVGAPDADALGTDGLGELRDLTPAPARALDEQGLAVSRDGSLAVTGWSVPDEPGLRRSRLVAIDLASGQQRVLADEPYVSFDSPAIDDATSQVVCVRSIEGTYDDPPRRSLWLIDLASGSGRELVPGADDWPTDPVFSTDGQHVFFTSDEDGRRPVFAAETASGTVRRVANDGHYTDLCVSPDGTSLFALRSRIDEPPTPVRLDANGVDQAGVELPAPGRLDVPGRVKEVEATGTDGQRVRGWLVLPADAAAERPAPLLLWVHGGPLSSWNAWSWRWNPWLMAARGYAVLLPDPALSTGYGSKMLQRGWGQWGGAPYDDLMAITDVVVDRPDIDESRTAAMGGSYGGYMANWIAGHTDRFRCIVTHASLWSLPSFMNTTDAPAYWIREWGAADKRPERYALWSPDRFADNISTPMLVIHGDKDYRVPIGEGLALWWDLQRRGVESKFLYFPDENHWILKPGGAQVWWSTVQAWLATHVLGEPWERPELV